ncbi:MAG: mechanosensitive ion channel domain-containing protein [Halanaeroarchaeum sp.]
MVDWTVVTNPEFRFIAAAAVLLVGLIAGYALGRLNARLLRSFGVADAVEGTTVERTARKFGTSTVALIARATSWLIYVVALLLALEVAGYFGTVLLLVQAGDVIPNLVLAIVIVFLGLLVADKAEVVVSEALRGVKLPDVGVIPTVVRYSVLLASFLLALAQVGVAVTTLIVIFGAYVFAIVVFAAVAFHQLLVAGAAGIYLLLNQPYGIGDEVAVGDREGVVQEVDIFVTRIESDGREHIVPNHLVFREGAAVIRD